MPQKSKEIEQIQRKIKFLLKKLGFHLVGTIKSYTFALAKQK